MAIKTLDTLGLKCPQPILKVATMVPQMNPGDILEVIADCESFPNDIKAWDKLFSKLINPLFK